MCEGDRPAHRPIKATGRAGIPADEDDRPTKATDRVTGPPTGRREIRTHEGDRAAHRPTEATGPREEPTRKGDRPGRFTLTETRSKIYKRVCGVAVCLAVALVGTEKW